MQFFVKVRVDTNKLAEFGRKLQAGELPTHPLITYCLKDDPSVGLNIWEAEDEEGFEKAFAPHREFYSEILEISPVILPQESMKMLMNPAAK
jgi:hypothetical protein